MKSFQVISSLAFTSEEKKTDKVYTTFEVETENGFTANCRHLVSTYDEDFGAWICTECNEIFSYS